MRAFGGYRGPCFGINSPFYLDKGVETRYNEKKYGESSNSTAHAGTGVTDVTVQQVAPKGGSGNTNENGDKTTSEDKDNVHDVANDNTWIVAPITGDTSKKPVRASVQPIANTGDENLVGIAAACGGIGAVLGTIALVSHLTPEGGGLQERRTSPD